MRSIHLVTSAAHRPSQPRSSARAAATPVAAFGTYPGRHSHGPRCGDRASCSIPAFCLRRISRRAPLTNRFRQLQTSCRIRSALLWAYVPVDISGEFIVRTLLRLARRTHGNCPNPVTSGFRCTAIQARTYHLNESPLAHR
jgi:hypothetical protein